MTKENFTDLKETYLYGKSSDRINFYKHYKNNENSMDDPIFTGFTFDIDTLHSPLFFTDSSYEDVATDTLRSDSNTSTELAEAIENRLANVYRNSIKGAPDSYEFNTLSTKDIIDSLDRRAGYGKQDKFYLDNVLYGATEYIYMVDKVSTGSYTDEIGNTNVGNGTPSKSEYDTYNDAVYQARKDAIEADEEVIEETVDPESGNIILESVDIPLTEEDITMGVINNEITNLKNSLSTESIKTEHNKNIAEQDERKEEYDEMYSEYKSAKDELSSLEKSIEDNRSDAKSKLSDLQSQAQTELTKLKNNLSSSNSAVSNIESIYAEYTNFYDNRYTTYTSIQLELTDKTDNQKYESYKKELTTEQDSVYNKDSIIKAAFNNAWEILNTKIISSVATGEIQEDIKKQKKAVQEKSDVLYGSGKSEANATEDSVYGRYQKAKETTQNDTYTQTTNQMNTLIQAKENYKDLEEYNAYNSTKTVTESTLEPLPTMDPKGEDETEESYSQRLAGYNSEVSRLKNTRETYAAPQTVYDMLGFIKGMKKLTHEYPYVMQSITGLDEAYKKYFVVKDPFMGSGDDKITISCYESLDLRVSSMFNKYFNAVYDHQYRRERIPVNLRRFQCSVFVHDIRNFRHSLSFTNSNFYEDVTGDGSLSKLIEVALNYMSAIEFKFYDCEIVPEETGTLFDNVSNETGGEMKKTNFTFTYGNCVINFLPFEDLKKYYYKERERVKLERIDTNLQDSLEKNTIQSLKEDAEKKSREQWEEKMGIKQTKSDTSNLKSTERVYSKDDFENETQRVIGNNYKLNNVATDGNFRRWFDKSSLGNVNNNDYRDYIRHSSSVEVDDMYKTSIVNSFALNSVTNKNQELTEMDEALRKIVVGISASTGIPVKGVTDALNIGNIYEYINKGDGSDMPKVTNLGNVTNSKIVDVNTTEYIGEVINDNESKETGIVTDLGKI